MMMGRSPQRVDMSPDRAWWMEDQDPAHHREDAKSRPEVRTHDPKDDRIKELEEKITRLRSEKAEPMMTTPGSSQGHAVQGLHARAREATMAPPTGGIDIGAGVGSLHTMLESVFITPPRSDDLIDLGSPRHDRGNEHKRRGDRGRADELPLPRNLDADMHRERIFGGHVGEYMEYLEEEDNTKYQEQFAGYIAAGIEADGLEELYESVHEKIREDPSPSEKKEFTPDKSFKRKAKLTLEQRKAAVQVKKDAKNAELEEDDE